MLLVVSCEWTWSETNCSAECGGGTKTRYPMITQRPQFGGEPCPSNESIECNTHPCPSESQKMLYAFALGLVYRYLSVVVSIVN